MFAVFHVKFGPVPAVLPQKSFPLHYRGFFLISVPVPAGFQRKPAGLYPLPHPCNSLIQITVPPIETSLVFTETTLYLLNATISRWHYAMTAHYYGYFQLLEVICLSLHNIPFCCWWSPCLSHFQLFSSDANNIKARVQKSHANQDGYHSRSVI